MRKWTNIWQLKHNGKTGFAKRDLLTGCSEGMGLPANEIEIIAQWQVKYKTFWQVIASKFKRAFAKIKKLKFNL